VSMSSAGTDLTLAHGERILWQDRGKLASSRAAVRGTLYMTTERLVHVSNRLLNRRGGRDLREWPLRDVRSVQGTQPRDLTAYRDLTPHSGSVNRRLSFRLKDGTTLLFLVKRRDEAVEELQGIIGDGVSSDGPLGPS
jgi:hypothetical protein